MSTRQRKSAVQPSPLKDHSPEQVKEVALMLYAQRPFPLSSSESGFISRMKSKSNFYWLVMQSFDFLDELDEFCEVVARDRKEAKEPAADAKKALPDVVPFDKAVKVITGQKHLDRAVERFETMVQDGTKLAHWRKNGMTRDEVLLLRERWDEEEYRQKRIATLREAKKGRKPWSDKKRIKVQLESSARELERQRKVDAARRLARGEIE
jgi:hypothetical protein